METLRATLALYRDAAVGAFQGLSRSAWALAALVLASITMALVGTAVAPLGIIGGFIVGFLNAYIVGWYLAQVDVGVSGRRRLALSDLRDALGRYFSEVISVMFIFWIAGMLLQAAGMQVVFIAVTIAVVAFNPVPEMIYSERSQGLQLLGDALSFMQKNWPEWLGAQLVGAAFLAVWGYLVFGAPSPAYTLSLLQSFGPWFGFISAGSQAIALASTGGVFGALAFLAFTHWFLLFRGHLYQKLSRSSRRGRAWQSRF